MCRAIASVIYKTMQVLEICLPRTALFTCISAKLLSPLLKSYRLKSNKQFIDYYCIVNARSESPALVFQIRSAIAVVNYLLRLAKQC